MKLALFVAVLIGSAQIAQAQQLFADGFESGDSRAWDGGHGNPSYPTTGCHSGRSCLAMTLAGGVGQQSPDRSKELTYSGPVFYVSMWRFFPLSYSWNGSPTDPNNFHHKLAIVDTADAVGRFHLNLSDPGSSPQFRPEFESVGAPSINTWTDFHYPADGKWHRIEFEITRKPGPGNGRLRIWLDGAMFFDKTGNTCGAAQCSPVVRIKVGAYVNQGAAVTQTFLVDDVVVYGGTREQANGSDVPPPPPPPQLTAAQHIQLALDAAAKQADALDEEILHLEALKAVVPQ